MESFVKEQKDIYTKILKVQTNFKKDSAERKTKEYAEARLQTLNSLWSAAIENNNKLEEYRNENPTHTYFVNQAFEATERLVEEIRDQLESALKDAIQRTRNTEMLQEQYKLINKQVEIIESLNRTNRLNEKIERETSPAFFTQNVKILEEYWQLIIQNHGEIIAFGKAKDTYFEDNMFAEAEERYQSTIIALQDRFSRLHLTSAPTPIIPATQMAIKLPNIDIPKFTGDYLQWKSFKDLFIELIHNNKSLGNTQKLFYLKANLGKEPYELIKHLQVTADNYETAWGILDKRFNNTRTLVAAQLKTLLGQASITKESAKAIKTLHDVCNESLLAIQNLGVKTENWDPLLVYMLVQKLDKESHRLYEQSLKFPRELQSLKHFFEFLEGRFQSLEALEAKATATSIEKPLRAYHGSTNTSCPICHHAHKIYSCEKFLTMTHQHRMDAIRRHKLCENCLVAGHYATDCKSWSKCRTCQKKHHTLIHKNHGEVKEHQPRSSQSRNLENSNSVITHFAINGTRRRVLLATALIKVQRQDGNFTELRALVDQGSQATFISEDAAQRLRLRRRKIQAVVSGIGKTNAGTAQTCVSLMVRPRFVSKFLLNVEALVLPKLTGFLPSEDLPSHTWQHLKGLTLADPFFYKPSRIDMIIGADVFSNIILKRVIKGRQGDPVAQRTEFGYILSGEIACKGNSEDVRCFISDIDLGKELCKFWESEELTPERNPTPEELECEMHFKTTHRRGEDGRYTVRLPFRIRPTSNELEGSRELALARLFQLERRFKTNRRLERMYKDFINEYIQLGHMVPATEDADVKYYLPHHAVFKHDSTTTKLRVVFDASIKRNSNKSLNDIMMTGSPLQQNLTNILVKWQKYKIVFTADIEKMYRQIKVDNRDQDVQRILWRDSPASPIREYKLTTVTYGTAAAPFLAIRTLQQLALDDGAKFPRAARIILRDTYVDDVVSGADNYQEAYEICNQLIELLKGGGFKLRKWNSNDARILNHIPSELKALPKNLIFDDGETIKTLGMHWDPKTDNLKFKINIQPDPIIITKRSILSEAARLFDPIGLLSPITIKIKLLFQQIWLETTDWDDAVSEQVLEKWQRIKEELPAIEDIVIPRWFGYYGPTSLCQLHGFSDASEQAYSAAVYIRTVSSNGEIITKLLAARTKVAPLRSKLSLPRLELNGALLLARLMIEIEKCLDLPTIQRYAWTDSTIVLSWLRGNPHQWKTFVGNRVAEIQSILGAYHWFYVTSENNPADAASRGVYPRSLLGNTLWWEGPKWLKKKEVLLPELQVPKTKLEMKTHVTAHMANPEESCDTIDELLQKHSSLSAVWRVTAYVLRFIHNLCTKAEERRTGTGTGKNKSN